jgi:hypothetical protein
MVRMEECSSGLCFSFLCYPVGTAQTWKDNGVSTILEGNNTFRSRYTYYQSPAPQVVITPLAYGRIV